MSNYNIRPMSKHNQSNNNTNQRFRRQNFSSSNRQQQRQTTQTQSVSPYTRQQPTNSRNTQTRQPTKQGVDHRYEPSQGNNGMIYHRPYHYPTDERPWAFGPPVYTDEWGNPTNVPVSNWDRAKDMGVDMLEGGMRGMFYAGFRYLERRIFQS